MKKKLVGKIITIFFALFTLAFMFMPQIQYNAEFSITGSPSEEALMASNVAPIDFIKALFATEEDYEQAKTDYDNKSKEIKQKRIEERIEAGESEGDIDIEVELSNTKEATRFIVLHLALTEDLFQVEGIEPVNAINGVKTYAYISIAMLVVTLVMLAVLVLRCFFPTNKFLNLFGNLWSILLFIGTIGFFFAAILPSAEYSVTKIILEVRMSYSMAIRAVPIFVMSAAFALISLVTMILTLTTKGVKREKQLA